MKYTRMFAFTWLHWNGEVCVVRNYASEVRTEVARFWSADDPKAGWRKCYRRGGRVVPVRVKIDDHRVEMP